MAVCCSLTINAGLIFEYSIKVKMEIFTQNDHDIILIKIGVLFEASKLWRFCLFQRIKSCKRLTIENPSKHHRNFFDPMTIGRQLHQKKPKLRSKSQSRVTLSNMSSKDVLHLSILFQTEYETLGSQLISVRYLNHIPSANRSRLGVRTKLGFGILTE